jgi:hypothetical protein
MGSAAGATSSSSPSSTAPKARAAAAAEADVFGIELVGWSFVASKLQALPKQFDRAQRRALEEEAEYMLEAMKDTLEQGIFEPLSELTLLTREHDGPPLSSMAEWVVTKREGDGIFIGIPDVGGGKNGLSRSDIAEIHETGAEFDVYMTEKQRAFVMALLREAGVWDPRHRSNSSTADVLHITIPARPWLQDTLDMHGQPEDVKERYETNLRLFMEEEFGIG